MKRVIKVDWIDSCSSNMNWTFPKELDGEIQAIRIISYGVIVQESDAVITIAQNYGYDPEQMCNFMTIPKGCINEIKDIDSIEEYKKPITPKFSKGDILQTLQEFKEDIVEGLPWVVEVDEENQEYRCNSEVIPFNKQEEYIVHGHIEE